MNSKLIAGIIMMVLVALVPGPQYLSSAVGGFLIGSGVLERNRN